MNTSIVDDTPSSQNAFKLETSKGFLSNSHTITPGYKNEDRKTDSIAIPCFKASGWTGFWCGLKGYRKIEINGKYVYVNHTAKIGPKKATTVGEEIVRIHNTFLEKIGEGINKDHLKEAHLLERKLDTSHMTLPKKILSSIPKVLELQMPENDRHDINDMILENIHKLLPEEQKLVPEIINYLSKYYNKKDIENISKNLIPQEIIGHLVLKVLIAAVKKKCDQPIDFQRLVQCYRDYNYAVYNMGALGGFLLEGCSNKIPDALAHIILRLCLENKRFDNWWEFSEIFFSCALEELAQLINERANLDTMKNSEVIYQILDYFRSNESILSDKRHLSEDENDLLIELSIENKDYFNKRLKKNAEKPLSSENCKFQINKNMTAAFNPNALKKIMQSKQSKSISYGELPEIDPDILRKVFDQMMGRLYEQGLSTEGIESYLREKGLIGKDLTLSNLQYHITLEDREIHKLSHMKIPQDEEGKKKPADNDVVKAFRILRGVMDLSDKIEHPNILSSKEERVILIAKFLCNCSIGQREGLRQLDLLLDQLGEESPNKGSSREALTSPEGIQTISEVENFINNYLRSFFESQPSIVNDLMTSNNAFTQELLSKDPYYVKQMVHQTSYLKNLLGQNLGLQNSLYLDRYIGCIDPELVNKSKKEVVEIFFKHYGPLFFTGVKEALNTALSKNPIQVFNEINSIIPHVEENMWSEDFKQLTDEGVAALLRGLQILESNSEESNSD